MAKSGRIVVDPKVGAYCRVTLDSGEQVLVSHEKGSSGGRLTVQEVRWWGLASGETLAVLDLDTEAGRAALAALPGGAPAGSAPAAALGALVEWVKGCPSAADVRQRAAALAGGTG